MNKKFKSYESEIEIVDLSLLTKNDGGVRCNRVRRSTNTRHPFDKAPNYSSSKQKQIVDRYRSRCKCSIQKVEADIIFGNYSTTVMIDEYVTLNLLFLLRTTAQK